MAATDSEIEIVKGVKLPDYQAMKERFENEGYFQAQPSGKLFDPTFNRLLSKADAADYLSPKWRFKTGGDNFLKDTLFFPIWLRDPTRKTGPWNEEKKPKKSVVFTD